MPDEKTSAATINAMAPPTTPEAMFPNVEPPPIAVFGTPDLEPDGVLPVRPNLADCAAAVLSGVELDLLSALELSAAGFLLSLLATGDFGTGSDETGKFPVFSGADLPTTAAASSSIVSGLRRARIAPDPVLLDLCGRLPVFLAAMHLPCHFGYALAQRVIVGLNYLSAFAKFSNS